MKLISEGLLSTEPSPSSFFPILKTSAIIQVFSSCVPAIAGVKIPVGLRGACDVRGRRWDKVSCSLQELKTDAECILYFKNIHLKILSRMLINCYGTNLEKVASGVIYLLYVLC